MTESWGDRSTLERTIQHVLKSMTQWGVLKPGSEKGSLVVARSPIHISEELSELAGLVRAIEAAAPTPESAPAGVGKSRLALETAASLSGAFADGAFFVSLAPLSDPELVLPAQKIGNLVRVLGEVFTVETAKDPLCFGHSMGIEIGIGDQPESYSGDNYPPAFLA